MRYILTWKPKKTTSHPACCLKGGWRAKFFKNVSLLYVNSHYSFHITCKRWRRDNLCSQRENRMMDEARPPCFDGSAVCRGVWNRDDPVGCLSDNWGATHCCWLCAFCPSGCAQGCAESSRACWIWWQAQFASLLQGTSEKVKRSCNKCGNALFSLSYYNDFLKRAWKEAFLELITACGLALITGEVRQCSIHVWINISEVSESTN